MNISISYPWFNLNLQQPLHLILIQFYWSTWWCPASPLMQGAYSSSIPTSKRSHPSSASNGCKSERKDNMSVFVLWARLLWVRQSQETSVATNRRSRRRKRSARLCWRESVKRLLNLPMYTKNSSSVSSLIDSTTFFSLPLSERSQTDTEKKDGKRYDKADKNEKKEN